MAYENVILVLVAVGLILFGSKKLPELFKSLGRAKVEYEKAKIESKYELAKTEQTLKPQEEKMTGRRPPVNPLGHAQDIEFWVQRVLYGALWGEKPMFRL